MKLNFEAKIRFSDPKFLASGECVCGEREREKIRFSEAVEGRRC